MPKTDKIVLQVGKPGVVVPGQVLDETTVRVPESEDDEMDRSDQRSPKKPRATLGQPVQLDVETLRGLLAEQAASIAESQRIALTDAIGGLKQDFDLHKAEVRRELGDTAAKVQSFEENSRVWWTELASWKKRRFGQEDPGKGRAWTTVTNTRSSLEDRRRTLSGPPSSRSLMRLSIGCSSHIWWTLSRSLQSPGGRWRCRATCFVLGRPLSACAIA